MKKAVDNAIALGNYLEDVENGAFDLWTHLPSYLVAQKHHGDYASEFRPSPNEVMSEASEFIYALSQNAEKEHHDLSERMKESYLQDTGYPCPCGEFHDTDLTSDDGFDFR